jgi:diguanylate cyclase (GGDEF)-like protein
VAVLLISPDGIEKTRKGKGPEAAAARLNQFAKALKQFVRRQSDFLGRFEQDKFIILYSGLSRPDLDMLILRIRETLSKEDWEDTKGEALSLSLGGVYALPGNSSVAAQWMLKADDALRRARQDGPGAVMIEEE